MLKEKTTVFRWNEYWDVALVFLSKYSAEEWIPLCDPIVGETVVIVNRTLNGYESWKATVSDKIFDRIYIDTIHSSGASGAPMVSENRNCAVGTLLGIDKHMNLAYGTSSSQISKLNY